MHGYRLQSTMDQAYRLPNEGQNLRMVEGFPLRSLRACAEEAKPSRVPAWTC
jgi:hypothetical protein